jgi:hypothetical protein
MKNGHKHADLMMEYAKDCKKNAEAYLNWEVKYNGSRWKILSKNPEWHKNAEYRRKPKTININGFEVPEPVREPLEAGQEYYAPCLDIGSLYCNFTWNYDNYDFKLLERGIIHLDKESAIKHAKALLSFTEVK